MSGPRTVPSALVRERLRMHEQRQRADRAEAALRRIADVEFVTGDGWTLRAIARDALVVSQQQRKEQTSEADKVGRAQEGTSVCRHP